MRAIDYTRFRHQLLNQRDQILALADDHYLAKAPIEIHEVNDTGDLASQQAVTTVSTCIAESEIRLLDKIDQALGRIDEGSYGNCEGCHRRIPVARLRAKPTAALCLCCQMEKERQIALRNQTRPVEILSS